MQYIVDIVNEMNYNKQYRYGMQMEVFHMKNKSMKIARIESDVSQEQLAEIVGVTRQTISLIESGNYNPSLKLCVDICKALNKTLDDLFWEV